MKKALRLSVSLPKCSVGCLPCRSHEAKAGPQPTGRDSRLRTRDATPEDRPRGSCRGRRGRRPSRSPVGFDGRDGGPAVRGLLVATVSVWLLAGLGIVGAADVHSNGVGGGAWSDPLTWRTKTVPASNDVVTVAGDDHVAVDLTDPERIACQELHVDPRGMLSFKTGIGRVVLNVGGIVESYGAIRMDFIRAEEDSAELRLAGATPPERELRLVRGGSLVMGGRADLVEGRRNVLLVSGPVPNTNAPPVDPMGTMNVQDGTSVDLLRAQVQSIVGTLASLDNTGAAPGERVSVVGCRFVDRSTLYFYACDTPVAIGNEFITEAAGGIAINNYASTLAELRGNTIKGPYSNGIVINGGDAVVISNTVEGAGTGIQAHAGNLMLNQHTSRKCGTGYYLVNAVTGVGEGCVADACALGFFVHHTAGLQLINSRAVNVASNAATLNMANSQLAFLNCDIATNQATYNTSATRTNETFEYLVVQVKGQVPADSQVEVLTANPAKPVPPGATDPNVRNSPAPIGHGGWTPLPSSLAALVVKSWSLVHSNKLVAAPQYIVRVLGPAPKPDAPRPVLKQVGVKPDDSWRRPNPNERKATLEITVP